MSQIRMKIGAVVRHKRTMAYGTVEYSTFGYSIHMFDEVRKALGKTLGAPVHELLEHWDVVKLPKGYERYKYGGIVRKEVH
ncbi:hypothetical protein MKY96_32820 [Paenibacillus sp. FSL R7-0302]|uniref:hypothetical protein n=1 Tax=Paenibacillus sp. FSL R7-0302 TaxID=2921681 RepID=UPI0030F5EE60